MRHWRIRFGPAAGTSALKANSRVWLAHHFDDGPAQETRWSSRGDTLTSSGFLQVEHRARQAHPLPPPAAEHEAALRMRRARRRPRQLVFEAHGLREDIRRRPRQHAVDS